MTIKNFIHLLEDLAKHHPNAQVVYPGREWGETHPLPILYIKYIPKERSLNPDYDGQVYISDGE